MQGHTCPRVTITDATWPNALSFRVSTTNPSPGPFCFTHTHIRVTRHTMLNHIPVSHNNIDLWLLGLFSCDISGASRFGFICLCVCMYVCVYVCVCAYIYIYIYIYIFVCMYVCMYMRTYTHVQTQSYNSKRWTKPASCFRQKNGSSLEYEYMYNSAIVCCNGYVAHKFETCLMCGWCHITHVCWSLLFGEIE